MGRREGVEVGECEQGKGAFLGDENFIRCPAWNKEEN